MLIYERLTEELLKLIPEMIRKHEWHFPTEMELCSEYGVSRRTVRRVLDSLEKSGFIKRRQGSGCYLTGLLPDDDSNRISILLSSPEEYIFPEILSSLRSELGAGGYTVAVHAFHMDFDLERRILRSLLDSPPRGIISECVCNLSNPNLDLYRRFADAGTCVIFLYGLYPNFPDFPVVMDDNFQGSFSLVQHLVSLGHRNIACLFQSDTVQGRDRLLGFQSGMISYGLPFSLAHTLLLGSEVLTGADSARLPDILRKFCRERIEDCSAIVCYNDMVAYALIRALEDVGLSVPGDISVVGFDDSYLRQTGKVVLTSLSHGPRSVGREASCLLTGMIKGQPAGSVVLPFSLVRGNSVLSRQ